MFKTIRVIVVLLLFICINARAQKKAYLFSYFENNGEDGLHLAYSLDGLKWQSLNNDSAVLKPMVAKDKLMRDPCIIKGADGLFHMVWTVSWKDRGIGYASSPDLIHWSVQQFIPVMQKDPAALNCWAPEITYDPDTKNYMLYWATTIPGRFPETEEAGEKNHRIYYTTTRDFRTYSETRLLYDQGFNVIDASIQKAGKQYVMFLKNETKKPVAEKNIRLAFSDKLTGGYGKASAPITGNYWAEGPTAIKIGNKWTVYFDKYMDHHYGAVQSADLKNWTDISDQLTMPKGIRHGTVLTITQQELRKLTDYFQTPFTLNNQLALTPPMGWSSWNTFKKEPSENVIKEIADAMVAKGLKAAGYEYVNIDDFWSTGRDSLGNIMVDTVKFPHGMKALADYIHSKGLKAGIYTNIGTKANYATLASGGFYAQDMKTFADWGYEYVKVDVNFAPVRTEEAYKNEFTKVSQAVKYAGRPMVFSICNQGGRDYWNWAPALGNTWRVGGDIDHSPKETKSQWEGVNYELDLSSKHTDIAGPGHWNDADMMLVGVGDDGGRLKVMNAEEQKAHFSMWCMIASPLIMGNDIRRLSPEASAILTNREAIAVNQDVLGKQGKLVAELQPGLQVWLKPLAHHKFAIALFNRTGAAASITCDFKKAGLPSRLKLRDIWQHKPLGEFNGAYAGSLPSHGVQMLLAK
ncbi:Alpha galactosidase A [Mucilaginibacter gossypiicola]|uniref:Alpha-galactosidase n=1 Tax=Mucilaginibacter gossypiicola TaxID=551995 RepID=A0A1H8LN20_9SPHI|nr:alpha-galactosidase [Mucilaginibacter gossypiicola]SEO06497.1 Alpha galactosidase A [Mucilaginibacter gossypiicola]